MLCCANHSQLCCHGADSAEFEICLRLAIVSSNFALLILGWVTVCEPVNHLGIQSDEHLQHPLVADNMTVNEFVCAKTVSDAVSPVSGMASQFATQL